VDIVLTLSFDYNTSRGDYGEVGPFYRPSDDSGSRLLTMQPRALTDVISPSPNRLTTTSITWTAKDVEAAGRAYEFQIGAAARDGNDNEQARVSGENFTVVIDILPAGDA